MTLPLAPPPPSKTSPARRGASLKGRLTGVALAVVILLADQFSKLWVVDHLMTGGHRVVEVLPFFNLVMTWNRGVSFGMFADGAAGPWMFLGFAGLLSVMLGIWLWSSSSPVLHVGLGAMIGGALGNGIDRVRWGAVADFLDLHALGWHFWAFNVADAAISVGAALLVADSLFRRPT